MTGGGGLNLWRVWATTFRIRYRVEIFFGFEKKIQVRPFQLGFGAAPSIRSRFFPQARVCQTGCSASACHSMQRIAKAELSVASEPINAPGEQDLLARELLGILPADGGSLTNRAARALVAQRLGRMVSSDAYFMARDQLLRDRVIGRVRGQGGSVFRLDGVPEAVRERSTGMADKAPGDIAVPPEATSRTIISERDLMFATQCALIRDFPAELDLPPGSPEPIVENISTTGPKTGIWARPDLVMACVSRFSILSGFHVDMHVFELKTKRATACVQFMRRWRGCGNAVSP
jgi:hypothetical protein